MRDYGGPGKSRLNEGNDKSSQLAVFVGEKTCFSGYSNRQTRANQYTGKMLARTQQYRATEKSLCHYIMLQVCWKELSMDVGQQLLDPCFMVLVRDKCGLHQSEDIIGVPEILGS